MASAPSCPHAELIRLENSGARPAREHGNSLVRRCARVLAGQPGGGSQVRGGGRAGQMLVRDGERRSRPTDPWESTRPSTWHLVGMKK